MNFVTDATLAEELLQLQKEAQEKNIECVVGALIVNSEGKVFAQKRAYNRKLFPGCWDIVGGHVENNETLFEALEREIEEETGWKLKRISQVVDIYEWEAEGEFGIEVKKEFDFLVEVEGNLEEPELEEDKIIHFDWFGSDNLDTLLENREKDDTVIFSVVEKALSVGD